MLPILFRSSFFYLYSYPLFMGLAWGVGYHLTKSLLERYSNLQGYGFFFWGNFTAAWIGSKVFYLVFSSGGQVELYASSSSFWLGGGFIFYGGLIFGLLFSLVSIFVFKKFSLNKLAYFLPGLAFGHAIGRLGCFLAGCCFGHVCELPWAIHQHGELRHPVQLYEALALFILGYFNLKMIKQKKSAEKIVAFYFIFYSLIRFIIEFFRGDSIRGLHQAGLSTSQYISVFLFILAFVLFLKTKNSSKTI